MKLAEALGTGGQSAGWGSYANQQRKAANWLLGLALGAFVAAAGFALWLAITAHADTALTWQRTVAKLAVTTAFGLVGGYLASQSGEHRHQERIARRRHLDLLALPLFIAELEETDRHATVQKLAENGFLIPDPMEPSTTKGVPTRDLGKIIESIGKVAKS